MTPPDRTDDLDPARRDRAQLERLSSYLDDELSPEEAREVLAWLETDPQALRESEEMRRVWDLLGRYPDETVPEGFAEKVLARVRAEAPSASSPAAPALRVLSGGRARMRVAAAAAVVLAAGLGAVAGRRFLGPNPAVAPGTSLEALPAEAIENLSDLAALSEDKFDLILSSDPEELAGLVGQGG